MQIDSTEGFIDRARRHGHPTRHLLAAIHRGDAFTMIFALTLKFLAWILGLLLGIAWLAGWGQIYHDYERWELVLAFVDQFFLLALLYVVLHVTYLRAEHLRQIPTGSFVVLQSTSLILRWIGECVLILAVGALGHALLDVPEPSWLSWVAGPRSEGELKAMALLSSGWWQVFGFAVFTVCYALAGAIEVLLALERNTHVDRRPLPAGTEVAARGREIATGPASLAASP